MQRLFKKYRNSLARGFFAGVGFVIALAMTSLAAITITGAINSFTSGDLISASNINENFSSLKSAIESAPVGTYCGQSASTYDGAGVGGYTGAKTKCQAACGNTNAHMCTAHEIVLSLQNGISVPGSLWISNYFVAVSPNAGNNLYDCQGWTVNTAGFEGIRTDPGGGPQVHACGIAIALACCL